MKRVDVRRDRDAHAGIMAIARVARSRRRAPRAAGTASLIHLLALPRKM